jgi:hypothetical protein
MRLEEAQTIIRGRTSCVGISTQSLTVSMADLDLQWMALGTEQGLRVRLYTAGSDGHDGWQLEVMSRDYHLTHALTYALARWFRLRDRE